MIPSETKKALEREPDAIDNLIVWIGSVSSLAFHTILFIVFFTLSLFGFISWSLMLLVLTTVVSLEAIYLAIFIQMTVNRHTKSLKEVEQDIDEIEHDIDELQEDVEEMSEDVEEMSEDDLQDVIRHKKHADALAALSADLQRVLEDLEALKKRSR